jgi:hypothetical protein
MPWACSRPLEHRMQNEKLGARRILAKRRSLHQSLHLSSAKSQEEFGGDAVEARRDTAGSG